MTLKEDESEASTYLCIQNEVERARLSIQDRGYTQAMGETYDSSEWATFDRALDIGCGTGGWVLDMARAHTYTHFTGVDINPEFIEHARAYQEAGGIQNAHLLVMDATKPLSFPSASFAMINVRLALSWLAPKQWPTFLRECIRLLRPGGCIRLTEYEVSLSNSPSFERIYGHLFLAVYKAGRSFSPSGRSLGATYTFPRLLKEVGFVEVQSRDFVIPIEPGNEDYAAWKEDTVLLVYSLRRLLISPDGFTQEDLTHMQDQLLHDMAQPHFMARSYNTTAWAMKPNQRQIKKE